MDTPPIICKIKQFVNKLEAEVKNRRNSIDEGTNENCCNFTDKCRQKSLTDLCKINQVQEEVGISIDEIASVTEKFPLTCPKPYTRQDTTCYTHIEPIVHYLNDVIANNNL